MTIYLECIQPRTPTVPVRLGLVRHGRNTFFRIVSDDGRFDLLLKAAATDFIDLLEPKLESLKASAGLSPPGILRGPEPPPRTWRERAEADVLELTPEMVIDYFARSEVLNTYLDDVKKVLLPLCASAPQDAGPDRLEADVALVRPHLAEIRKPGGDFHQGKIAAALQGRPLTPPYPQTGGSYRERILEVCEALEAA